MYDYRGNKSSFEKLAEYLAPDKINMIDKIIITGSYSPEGVLEHNINLASKRAASVRSYISYSYPHVNRGLIQMDSQSNALAEFVAAVTEDQMVPRRDKVLEILHSNSSMATKWANIKLLQGDPATYIEQKMFSELRSAVSFLIVMKPKLSAAIPEPLAKSAMTLSDSLTVHKFRAEAGKTGTDRTNTEPSVKRVSDMMVKSPAMPKKIDYIRKPLFAAKTNLLFDAATLLNVELEVPIGKRWSVAAEWVFPWWLWEDKQNCLQMGAANIEGKYWFGNRNDKEQLTGWFAGLYVGGGYYDLEWNKVGYQGEFFIAAGISAGYAHTIAKNLRLEYSLGIGYMQTHYRKYDAEQQLDGQWNLYRSGNGIYTWIGPTRARVSLVWIINGRKKGGR